MSDDAFRTKAYATMTLAMRSDWTHTFSPPMAQQGGLASYWVVVNGTLLTAQWLNEKTNLLSDDEASAFVYGVLQKTPDGNYALVEADGFTAGGSRSSIKVQAVTCYLAHLGRRAPGVANDGIAVRRFVAHFNGF